MFKIIAVTAFCLIGFTSIYAQETIDQRLVKNRGKQAEESFKYNKNGYNYFLFELDRSHWIADKSTLTPAEEAIVQPAASFHNADNQVLTLAIAQSPGFNFYDFGIHLRKDQRICIALDAQNVLFFYAIPELSQLFINSDANVK